MATRNLLHLLSKRRETGWHPPAEKASDIKSHSPCGDTPIPFHLIHSRLREPCGRGEELPIQEMKLALYIMRS